MKKTIYMALLAAIISLVGFNVDANAQRNNRNNQTRVNQGDLKNLVGRIEKNANQFSKSANRGSGGEESIKQLMNAFENATDRLKKNYKSAGGYASAQEVLRHGQTINGAVRNSNLPSNVQGDWNVLRGDLDQLARLYNISWTWNDDRYDNRNRDRRNGNNRVRNNRRNGNNRYGSRYGDIETLIENIENKADSFRKTVDSDLDDSRRNGKRGEDRINDLVKEFENATDKLRDEYDDDNRADASVQEVLRRGKTIDDAMRRLRGSTKSKNEWNSLRGDLNQLARFYNISWNWSR
jgi:hypothetical protein